MPVLHDVQAEAAFWQDHDAQMFPMRMSFLTMSLMIYPAFGLLDWSVGGENMPIMLAIRAVSFITLLFATIRFAATENTPDTRERLIKVIGFATIGCELMLILLGSLEAAQYHQFGLCVIIGLGAIILVPRFKTTAILFAITMVVYFLTLYWHPGDIAAKIVNSSFNVIVAGAVLVGSFERERLARAQVMTSLTLAQTNEELVASRQEALKARDAAVAANRSKNHFLANMSHELRTPLNAILGFSDMMRSEMFGPVSEPRYRSYIDHIHTSGTLLHTNINDLLDLARLDSGKFGWEDKVFDLCTTIQNVIATCDIGAREAGVSVTYVSGTPDTMIEADQSRLAQVLINLITNAIKFTESGGKVEISTVVDADGVCSISVHDTGCGMSMEDLERVRTPFAQAHEDSYSKGKGGLGLGLAIVCGIADRIDGQFILESEEGVGTLARLILPPARVSIADTKAA